MSAYDMLSPSEQAMWDAEQQSEIEDLGNYYRAGAHPNMPGQAVAQIISPWIPVTERLPDFDGLCLVSCVSADPDMPFRTTAWYTQGYGWSAMLAYWIPSISHWMPFPEAPK